MVDSTLIIVLFGVINILFIPISFYMCWEVGGRFSFVKYPLSFASKTKAKPFYSTTLILIAFFQTLFIIGLFYIFPITQTVLLTGLFLSGMASLVLAGVVTSDVNRFLHRFLTGYMIVSITTWAYFFSNSFSVISPQTASIGHLIAIVASFGVPLLYLKTRAFGLSELLFAFLTMSWNSTFIYLLL